MVASGILASRLVGFVRSAVVAHFLGNGAVAGAWTAAFRIPNFLQNLFGEGALSASFIPVYAQLRQQGEDDAARRVAGAVAALLGLVTALLVALGVLATPVLIDLIAPGFSGSTRDLTIRLVRIAFPGTGLLVLSAWCLGVLNSHRRFFLSYAAPVAWNVAIIIAFVLARGVTDLPRLAELAMWGAVAGSLLQLLVQLPSVLGLLGGLRLSLRDRSPELRTVIRNFVPVATARGVTQVSSYVDTLIASLIAASAVASLGYAQLISTLPVSLFGMSVSASELPEMASASGSDEEVAAHVRGRLDRGLAHVAYFVVPSAIAFLAIGHVLAALLFESGRFSRADSLTVWSILGASSVGLLAATMGRLYSSSFYALRDTRSPLRYALARVAIGLVLGWLLGVRLPPALGIAPRWATAGLALAAAIAACVEFTLLRRGMNARIGRTGLRAGFLARIVLAAVLASVAAWVALAAFPLLGPKLGGIAVAGTFGIAYLFGTYLLAVPQARGLLDRIRR